MVFPSSATDTAATPGESHHRGSTCVRQFDGRRDASNSTDAAITTASTDHPATPGRVDSSARRQVQRAAMVERIKAAIGPEASARYFRSPAAS